MSKKELEAKIEALTSWESIIAEAQAEAEAIRDSIKAEMAERGVDVLESETHIIRWSNVLSNRFDSSAFKKIYGDLYKAFTKQVQSKRFSIA